MERWRVFPPSFEYNSPPIEDTTSRSCAAQSPAWISITTCMKCFLSINSPRSLIPDHSYHFQYWVTSIRPYINQSHFPYFQTTGVPPRCSGPAGRKGVTAMSSRASSYLGGLASLLRWPYIHLHVIYVHIHLYTHVDTCSYKYICSYIYIYIRLFICTYTYIHRSLYILQCLWLDCWWLTSS